MAAPVDPIVKLVQVQGSAPGAMTDVNISEVGGVTVPSGNLPVLAARLNADDMTEVRINQSASGDTTVIAAVAAQTTKIYAISLSVAAPTVIQIKNGAGSVLQEWPLAQNGGFVLTFMSRPWYTTSANTAFIINSSAAISVQGRAYYVTSA